MRHLKGIDYDRKAKVSGSIEIEGVDEKCRYVSTKLNEKYTIYKDSEEIGVVLVKKLKVNDSEIENINVGGEFNEKWLSLLDPDSDVDYTVEQDSKAIGVVKVEKGKWDDWRPIHINNGLSLDVAEYIYEPYDLEYFEGKKDLSWVKDKQYEVLRTKEEFDNYIELLNNLPKDTLIGLDTESTGLRANHLKTDSIVGISISHKIGYGAYIPLAQKNGDNQEYSVEEVMEKLKPLVDKREDTSLGCVLVNAGFDWKIFKQYGIEINVAYDLWFMLSIIAYSRGRMLTETDYYYYYSKLGYPKDVLHDAYYKEDITKLKVQQKSDLSIVEIPDLTKRRPTSLKGSIEFYFGIDVLELSDMFKSKSDRDFEEAKRLLKVGGVLDELSRRKLLVENLGKDMLYDFRYAPEWFYTIYGPADADFPLMLLDKLTSKGGDWDYFNGELDVVLNIEHACLEIIGEQEFYGVVLEVDGINMLGGKAKETLKNIEKEIYELVGYEFNINSNQQKSTIMFDELGYPKLARFKTKSGGYSTGKDTLNYLSQFQEDGKDKYPLASLLQKHSKLSKQITSFYDKLPVHTDHGFLNPSYNVMGAATGRISCSSPNIQQMEPSSRSYVMPRDGMYFSICDFSQVERRLMGGLSGDPSINQRFIDDEEADSHIQTYSNMMGVPYELVTSPMRKIGKILNFATGYGISAKKLALQIYRDDSDKHVAMAQDLINKYFESVPVYKKFTDKVIKESMDSGYSKTYFGRRRHIKEYDIKKPREFELGKGDRAAVNMVVQGTAVDILKLAMARLRKWFIRYGYLEDEARAVMNVHDEVTYEIANYIHPYIVCYIMKNAMEVDLSKQGFPPLYVGMNLGHCWKDGKRDDLEAPVILMEEIAEKGKAMLELPKEERPQFSGDPVDFWRDEIIKFSIKTLIEEVNKGYVTGGELEDYKQLEDFHKNVRVPKYAGYFGSLIGHAPYVDIEGFNVDDFIIFAYLNNDYDYVYDNLLDYMKTGNNLKNLVVDVLNNGEGDKRNIVLGLFGEYGKSVEVINNITDYSIKRDKTGDVVSVEIVTDEETIKMDSDKYRKGKVGVDRVSEELEDDHVSINDLIKESLKIYGGIITWKMNSSDIDVMDQLEKITLDLGSIHGIGLSTEDAYKLKIELPGGTPYEIEGWLIKPVLPLMVKIIKAHYSDLPYDFIENDLDAIAEQFIEDE